ncbi:MAG: hypothetical protein MZW92_35980 [Comamonadaceae bacterium]|nr:hypothetical protein [Comamonadaceae bacterium]
MVVESGPGADRFRPGEAVFGMQTLWGRMGCHAEYVAIAESALARKPDSVSHVEAAAAPCAALTAWDALVRTARMRPVARLLVIGAAGGVGTYAVQLAKALGAAVTAVDQHRQRRTGALPRRGRGDRLQDAAVRGGGGRTRRGIRHHRQEDLETVRPVLAADGRYITTLPNDRSARQAFTSRVARLLRGGHGCSAHVALVRGGRRSTAAHRGPDGGRRGAQRHRLHLYPGGSGARP